MNLRQRPLSTALRGLLFGGTALLLCAPLAAQTNTSADGTAPASATTTAANADRPTELVIPEVTVSVTGLRYTFVVPGIIGLGSDISLPAVTVTRTGEDLYSAPAE